MLAVGYPDAAGHMTDDVALARGLAARGWRIAFHDAGALLRVDMHESAARPGGVGALDRAGRRHAAGLALADVAFVWLVLGLPWLRLAAGRPQRLDWALLAVRLRDAGTARVELHPPRSAVLALAAGRRRGGGAAHAVRAAAYAELAGARLER